MSTYDGISIAWAIVEYLHEHSRAQARTLFATHYHELNEMEKNFPRIKNFNVSVKEVDGKIIFVRKLEKGGSEHSFGIHVAEIAGMPRSIVKRANIILKELEKDNSQVGSVGKAAVEHLDQTPTIAAIAAFQDYLDIFPEGKMKSTAQQRLFDLQDKLIRKEYLNAKLYYNLGSYFGNCTSGGNNYEACIITAQNALNDYPYSNLREDFSILIMKSKYELAQMSVESKKLQRYQDAEDECYGFINEYPNSKERKTAEDFIKKCKQITKD